MQGISEAIGRDVDSEVGDLRLGKNMRKIGCERWAVRRCVACMTRDGRRVLEWRRVRYGTKTDGARVSVSERMVGGRRAKGGCGCRQLFAIRYEER